ncbi:MAG: hypothetical protein DRO15_05650 [Thermoprotei archaeon]|nr:MAG: hypothetical protein DRO15_05650 [Thermoprotei archaeon]
MKLRPRIVIRAILIPLIIGLYGFGILLLIFLVTQLILDIFGQLVAFTIMVSLIIPSLYLWYILTKLIRSRATTKHR